MKTATLTKTEIKAIDTKNGGAYFSKGAMRFFNSRLETPAKVKGQVAYFITSEQFDEHSKRKYTVRQIDLTSGDIGSYSEFQQFDFIEDAKEMIKSIIKGA